VSLVTGISISDFVSFGGITGTASTSQLNLALQLGWESVEEHAGTLLFPTAVTSEIHPWPANGTLMLKHTDVSAIGTVLAKHDEETCDCDVLDVTGCAILVDGEQGRVRVKECYAAEPCAGCKCSSSHQGKWLAISYTAGIPPPLSYRLKLAVVLAAKDYLGMILGGNTDFEHMKVVSSWHSMSYGESYREKVQGNPFSLPSRADAILELIRPWPRKRAVALGSPRSARII
jgi:hypothetical protein